MIWEGPWRPILDLGIGFGFGIWARMHLIEGNDRRIEAAPGGLIVINPLPSGSLSKRSL